MTCCEYVQIKIRNSSKYLEHMEHVEIYIKYEIFHNLAYFHLFVYYICSRGFQLCSLFKLIPITMSSFLFKFITFVVSKLDLLH